jgi:peptidoglycan/LPS O-acetylase OafA/YrhL
MALKDSAGASQHTGSHGLDALLSLRAIGCLMVLVAHCQPPREFLSVLGYDLSWLFFAGGGIAVRMFFVLSGYLMGKAFYTGRYLLNYRSILEFYRNRLLRIAPLYYFAIFFLAIFVYSQSLAIENWGYLLRLLTFTYNHSLPLLFNAPLWTLSTEVQFYLVVPFIFALLQPRLRRLHEITIAAIAVVVFVSIYRWVIWITPLKMNLIAYWYTPLIANLDIFLLGFLVNPLLRCDRVRLGWESWTLKYNFWKSWQSPIAIAPIALLYLWTSFHIYYGELRNLPGHPGGIQTAIAFFLFPTMTAIATAIFIATVELNPPMEAGDRPPNSSKLSLQTCLNNPLRIIEVFGHLSYGIYVWHWPILAQITPLFTSDLPLESFTRKLIATFLLSTVVAIVTFYLVERPAARWKRYRWRSRQS